MHLRILDLDGGILSQRDLLNQCQPQLVPFQDWGPRIRIGCSFRAYRHFERSCEERLATSSAKPLLTLYGSGDFHHVTLALLRRLHGPFNLLVLDKHPDWMRGMPLMHCGTWLSHALRLPNLQRVFHVGGELDFDNSFRWLAPWRPLRAGTISVFPAVRRFARGNWRHINNTPLRAAPDQPVNLDRLDVILAGARADLARHPLYISLDKDVMQVRDAVVNWDSGYLELSELQTVLTWFLSACRGNLAGMDILGDWSPVRVTGFLRRALHATEHPSLAVSAKAAARCNATTNLALIETVRSALSQARRRVLEPAA